MIPHASISSGATIMMATLLAVNTLGQVKTSGFSDKPATMPQATSLKGSSTAFKAKVSGTLPGGKWWMAKPAARSHSADRHAAVLGLINNSSSSAEAQVHDLNYFRKLKSASAKKHSAKKYFGGGAPVKAKSKFFPDPYLLK